MKAKNKIKKEKKSKSSKKSPVEKTRTKIYITSNHVLTMDEVKYLIMSNKGFVFSVVRITDWNWLAEFEYDKTSDLLKILKTKIVRGKPIAVKRVFKSMRLSPVFKKEVCKSFLMQVAMGISGLIKKKVDVRITNNRANDWQRELTVIWQKELDHPNIFKKAKLIPKIDIAPKGKLEFVIVRTG